MRSAKRAGPAEKDGVRWRAKGLAGRAEHRSAERPRGTALVTGCSSGIGRATALALHEARFTVYAGARCLETLDELAAVGIRTVALDVTDEASIQLAVQRVEADCSAVDVLVNNAGYGLSGMVEETSMEAIRKQFETNVFGPARLTQLVLPGMRRQASGTIVNLSSIFGRYAVPGGGYYHATKHAIEALSDALRLEVAPFGINVIVVQPGPVLTRFGDQYVSTLVDARRGPYGEFLARAADYYNAIYTGSRRTFAGKFASSADDVARVITRAVLACSPRLRYPVGLIAHTTLALRRLMPDRLFDLLVVRRRFPVPRRTAQQRSLAALTKGSFR